MLATIIALLALAALGAVADAAGSTQGTVRLERGRFEKAIQYQVILRHLLYLPPEYGEKEARWPMIVYLHGGAGRGSDFDKMPWYPLSRLLRESGSNLPFVVLMPQRPEDDIWDVAAPTPPADVSAPPAAAMKAAADYSKAQNGQTCVVMFDGKVVFERYDNGGAADKAQMLASGSKSFVGLAAVAAVQDKVLNLDDPASDGITEWKNDPDKAKITYRQLLTMTSGLTPGEWGNAVKAPAWKEIAGKPLSGKPGAQFAYGAYHLNAFAYALERKLGTETFEAYLKRRILDPIGIRVEWRFRCADNHPQVGGGAFVTAKDWAKYGEFVRLRGTWDGKEVVDAKLLAECFQGTPQNPAYGLTWWLKKEVTAEQLKRIPILAREWGDVANADWLPADLVAACGAGKQRLYVIPSLKLVIVRQGGLSRGFSDLEFLSLLLRGKSASK